MKKFNITFENLNKPLQLKLKEKEENIMNKRRSIVFIGFVVICISAFGVYKAAACTEGCTPGFWKNHLDMWVGFNPYQTLGEALSYPSWTWPAELIELRDVYLIDALSFKGGPGELGAARIMLRQAVAALLNTAHPDVHHFNPGVEWVKNIIRTSLDTVDRAEMLWRAGWFEYYNELGCPLSRGGEETIEFPRSTRSIR